MELWIKIAVIVALAVVVYREILKSASLERREPQSRAGVVSLMGVGIVVSAFVYAGMSVTLIETRDMRPYIPKHSQQIVSIFDKGIIELNGMVIKTNLADPGELRPLSDTLTRHCHGDETCEVQSMFDYVTQIPYRTDHTSRNANEVIRSNWGDCDDKSNLFASLLNEKGFEYRFVYVPQHVFVIVHLNNPSNLPFLSTKLSINGKNFYYAETTASGARIGEFNGQFPGSFQGIYDIQNHQEVDLGSVSFSMI